ncbi:MAG: hypothetical protein Kow00109_02600 [Acidobacteriota bacterium]
MLLISLFGVGLVLAQTNFETSLHYTRQGKFTAYSAANGGMERITGIPMEDLACWKCHSKTGQNALGQTIDPASYVPGCTDCHGENMAVAEQTCLNCHSRQVYERQRYGTDENPKVDVHMAAGMTCWSCHQPAELHGDDGVLYPSLKAPGALKVSCEKCHQTVPANEAHVIHEETVDCAACHAEGSVACASCHFETLLATGKNRAINQIWNFKILVKKDGKVRLGSFMTHTYNGKTNVIVSSFHSHTIKREASDCKDCHLNFGGQNNAIAEYNQTGHIRMTRWNEETRKIQGPTGVVPIPADWRTSLLFDFAQFNGDPTNLAENTDWSYLKSEVDNAHLFYAEPLDVETMRKLGFDVSQLESPFAEVLYFPLFGDGMMDNVALRSSLLLANTGTARDVTLEFFSSSGELMPVVLNEGEPAATYELTFGAGQVFVATTPGTNPSLDAGYAVVKVHRTETDEAPSIQGTVVFSRIDSGVTMTEVGVPAAQPMRNFSVLLDSRDAKDTGIALVNPLDQGSESGSAATVRFRVWNPDFDQLLGEATVSLDPGQALSKFVWEIFQDAGAPESLVTQLQDMVGVVTVSSDIPVAALTLRQNDSAAPYPEEVPILTAFPVMAGRADQD